MTWRVRYKRWQGLRRFRKAQDPVWEKVLDELADGRKRTHWMWFVFPQELGLGHSEMSQVYGLTKREARRYLRDPILHDRLSIATNLVILHAGQGRTLEEIFGSVDAMKFQSSMQLFAEVAPEWR